MTERRLTIDGINDQYGVNPDTIYKWITRKRMPAPKVGTLWKFLASEVDEWVNTGVAGRDSTEIYVLKDSTAEDQTIE